MQPVILRTVDGGLLLNMQTLEDEELKIVAEAVSSIILEC